MLAHFNLGTAFPKPQHTWEAKFIHEVPMEVGLDPIKLKGWGD